MTKFRGQGLGVPDILFPGAHEGNKVLQHHVDEGDGEVEERTKKWAQPLVSTSKLTRVDLSA